LENFIKKFQKIGKWRRRHVASCNLGKNLFFFCKIGKFKTPLSPLSSHFDILAKGGELCNRNPW
jgi:hypothetical protein